MEPTNIQNYITTAHGASANIVVKEFIGTAYMLAYIDAKTMFDLLELADATCEKD